MFAGFGVTRSSQRDEVLSWSDAQFCHALQAAFGWRLGRITQAGKRSAYPLARLRRRKCFPHRTVVVGNAAQTLHPIAGQGFNLGLRDVMSMAETLVAAQDAGEDIGAWHVLSRYQQRRQVDRDTTIGVTNGLVHLFANRWAAAGYWAQYRFNGDGIITACTRCAGTADLRLGCALSRSVGRIRHLRRHPASCS